MSKTTKKAKKYAWAIESPPKADGSVSYQARRMYQGKTYYMSTYNTAKEAHEVAAKLPTFIKTGKFPADGRLKKTKLRRAA